MYDSYMTSNKIFYHQDRIQAYVKNEIVKPVSVKLRLTDRCNLQCYYCSYKDKLTQQDMEIKEVGEVLKKLKELEVKSIVFTGGEPTCYGYLNSTAKLAKELYQFDLGLITNGVIFPDILDYITWIRFSLDTIDRKIFKESRKVDRLIEVIDNINHFIRIKNIRKPEVTVGIQIIVNQYNFDYQFKEIIEVIKYAALTKADYIQIRPLENYKYSKDELTIIEDNIKMLKGKDFGIKILYTDYKWKEIKNNYTKEYMGCPSADFIGSIDVNGDFYMCCAMIGNKSAKYGNLIKDGADKILNNRKKVQSKFNYSKCTLACQGALLNQTLANFKSAKHINFV